MVSFTRFARASSPSPSTDEKMDRRFSTLFMLPTQPENTAPPLALGGTEEISQERETVGGMRTEGKSTREKMDRRFSTLFILPAQNTPPSTPPSEEESPAPRKQSQKQSLKLFFRRVFTTNSHPEKSRGPTPTPEELGNQLWAKLIGEATRRPSVISTVPSPSRATKQRSQTTVVVPAPLSSFNSSPRSRFSQAVRGSGKNGRKSGVEVVRILQTKRPDSKFSSITSLPSVQSLSLPTSTCTSSSGTVTFSPSSLLLLESGIRRLRRGLRYQEYLTSHLSNNLVFLFGRKEKQIDTLRRLRPDEKTALTAALFRVKESSGRTFLRKAVFLQRSQEVVAQISELLKKSTDGKVEDNIFDLLSLLGEDLKTQRELDDALTRGILRAATEKRWVGSAGEKTILRKFCRFVEGRVGVLDACYGKVGGFVRRMERVERQ